MHADDLDIENRAALQRYLWSNFSPAEEFEIREFEVLAGGVSSRTVRVLLAGGQEWVLKQALAKLRVEADWFSDPRRVHREALGMKVLAELTPPGSVPKLIFDDEHHHVLAMEAVPRPHENWKSTLLSGRYVGHCWKFGDLLRLIHFRSFVVKDDLKLDVTFRDKSFFETLRLEPYYEYSALQVAESRGFYDDLLAVTRSTGITLVHGDFSPKNVLVSDKGAFVLLDHEVIHWGDPAFDVGFALTHLLSKANHLPAYRQRFSEGARDFWTSYRSSNGWPEETQPIVNAIEQRSIRHTLGCLLARVVGRSPLEYLTPEERTRQREAVVQLMHYVPRDVPELIERFVQEIER